MYIMGTKPEGQVRSVLVILHKSEEQCKFQALTKLFTDSSLMKILIGLRTPMGFL